MLTIERAILALERKTTIPGDGFEYEEICEAIDMAIDVLKEKMTEEYPYFTQDGEDLEPDSEGWVYVCGEETHPQGPMQYIANLRDGAVAGYKYFEFEDVKEMTIRVRPHHAASGWTPSREEPYCKRNAGIFLISTEAGGSYVGKIPVEFPDGKLRAWREFAGTLQIPDSVHALYLEYRGEGALDLLNFELI